jgi:hypothetical protein
LFFLGEHALDLPSLPNGKREASGLWGSSGKDARILETFRRLLSRMTAKDRQGLLAAARKMASKRKKLKQRLGGR